METDLACAYGLLHHYTVLIGHQSLRANVNNTLNELMVKGHCCFVVSHELSLTSFNAGVDGIYEIYAQ